MRSSLFDGGGVDSTHSLPDAVAPGLANRLYPAGEGKIMLGLRHLALKVKDLDRAVEFYTGVLGMRIDWQPDKDNVYLTSGSDNLALHHCDEPNGGGSLDHFGFMVSRSEEVDEWALRLTRQGVAMVQHPETHRDGSRSLYFRDPDENLIQMLFHPKITA